MTDFQTLLQNGNAWIFVPSAILLGALHGLEPGHSKTMMAAFIVAIRGTVMQAVLLGLAATVSHTAIVWAIALAGMWLGAAYTTEAIEPYLQIISALIILSIAAWMIWRTWDDTHHGHDHDHPNSHNHHHGDDHNHDHLDAHARAHADDIERRFAGGKATTSQIVLFGLTGGLIPCPASVTVLLLCLQLKKFALGAALVLSFSVGLAITLVGVGAAAALSVKHASTHWSGFDALAARAPYLSAALIVAVGLYTGYLGLTGLGAHHTG